MWLADGSFLSSDGFGGKLAIGLTGAVVGFALNQVADQIKARRAPRKRISYELSVGSAMATVPKTLADKVSVQFEGQPVDGQLYEVTCRIENTGNQVVKKQYLRFSFRGAEVMDAVAKGDVPPEYGVETAPLEPQPQSDRRWVIGHLEKGESIEFGFLVAGPAASLPEVRGHNEEGGVELVSRAAATASDDADHLRKLVPILLVSWFISVPNFGQLGEFLGPLGNSLRTVIQLALLAMAAPHLIPVGRLLALRLKDYGHKSSNKIQIFDSKHVIVGDKANVAHKYSESASDPADPGTAT